MDNGGHAFPLSVNPINALDYSGMTLRDYFAAKAMQAGISGMSARRETFMYEDIAGFSYEVADAMLKERNK